MEQPVWIAEFRSRVINATAGLEKFPIIFELTGEPSCEECRAALRVAREFNPLVYAVVHHRNYADGRQARSYLEVLPGTPDQNPPAFMEHCPRPLAPDEAALFREVA